MNSVVEEIKQKTDIVDLVGSYVSLKHTGKYFKANCPFHQEKTPSFVVSPDIQRWHCFGACHEGGDIFNFVMKWENVTFAEALQILADRAGVHLEKDGKKAGFQDEDVDKKETIFRINELAMKYYHYVLHNTPLAEPARAYLAARELPEAIIETFGIGYAPEGWSNLRDYLVKKGLTDSQLVSTGLFVQGDRGLYDRFRGRIMFPIHNVRGKVIGFSGRLIKENPTEKDGGKYVNTPETLVYHKRESLYGFYFSKEHIRKENKAMVVEGEFDMLTPYAKGIANIVAIKGSAFTEEQLQTLRRYTNRLLLALDSDEAGFDALKKTTIEAQKYGFELYVCMIPGGKDPDEAARHSFIELKKSIENAIPVYDFLIDTLYKKVSKEDPFTKKKFAESVIPYLHIIENPIVKTHYIQKVAALLEAGVDNVSSMLRDFGKKVAFTSRMTFRDVQAEPAPSRAILLQKHILAYLLTHENEVEKISTATALLEGEEFTQPNYQDLYNAYSDHLKSKKDDLFSEHVRPELRPLYDELFLYSSMVDASENSDILRAVLEYKKLYITENLQRILTSEEEADDAHLRELNNKLNEVEKQLKAV